MSAIESSVCKNIQPEKTTCCSSDSAVLSPPSHQLERQVMTVFSRQLGWENKVLSWHISIAPWTPPPSPPVPERMLLVSKCLCRAEHRQSFDRLMHTARHEEGRVSPFAGMWMHGRQPPLGEVMKQTISFWGHLIAQPAPPSLTALGLTETEITRRKEGVGTRVAGWATPLLVLGCDSRLKGNVGNISYDTYVS